MELIVALFVTGGGNWRRYIKWLSFEQFQSSIYVISMLESIGGLERVFVKLRPLSIHCVYFDNAHSAYADTFLGKNN
jgi:hypothetical protein